MKKINEEICNSIRSAKRAVDKKKYSAILVTGDFNFPYVKWMPDGSVIINGKSNSSGDQFVDLINDEHLVQNVKVPTFMQANGVQQNILDYVITESEQRIDQITTGHPLGDTDQGHLILSWDFELESSTQPNLKTQSNILNYRRGNYDLMREHISKVNWNRRLDNLDPNSQYESFLSVYNEDDVYNAYLLYHSRALFIEKNELYGSLTRCWL